VTIRPCDGTARSVGRGRGPRRPIATQFSIGTLDLVAEVAAPIELTGAEAQRTWIDERSWVDLWPGWVAGADALFDHLGTSVAFRQGRVYRYDHWVDEPRLGAGYSTATAPHPILLEAQRTLQHHYGVRFGGASIALYRDGRDMVAFHRDRDMRWLDDTVIALLVLGRRRPFAIRPRANRYDHEHPAKGATHQFTPGDGDLLVMGGATQAGWEHSVTPQPGLVGGRMSVQWRWTSKLGRMERGGSYRAPRHYGRG
jgi:alkylated DNA repair dioxygenase AlkB